MESDCHKQCSGQRQYMETWAPGNGEQENDISENQFPDYCL